VSALTCIPIFSSLSPFVLGTVAVASAWHGGPPVPYVIYWDISGCVIPPLSSDHDYLGSPDHEDTDSVKPWLRFGCSGEWPQLTPSLPFFPPSSGLYGLVPPMSAPGRLLSPACFCLLSVFLLFVTPWLVPPRVFRPARLFADTLLARELRIGMVPMPTAPFSTNLHTVHYVAPRVSPIPGGPMGDWAYVLARRVSGSVDHSESGRFAVISLRNLFTTVRRPRDLRPRGLKPLKIHCFAASSLLTLFACLLALRQRRPHLGFSSALLLYPCVIRRVSHARSGIPWNRAHHSPVAYHRKRETRAKPNRRFCRS